MSDARKRGFLRRALNPRNWGFSRYERRALWLLIILLLLGASIRYYHHQRFSRQVGIWVEASDSLITEDNPIAIPTPDSPLELNGASAGELELLPGIGPHRAKAIIIYRERNGDFTNVRQLDQVPGIGPKTIAKITPLVSIAKVERQVDRIPGN